MNAHFTWKRHSNEYKSCSLKYFAYKILPVESPNEKLTPLPFCFLTSSATKVMLLQSLIAHTHCISRDAQGVLATAVLTHTHTLSLSLYIYVI
jgi:hypothetical protein